MTTKHRIRREKNTDEIVNVDEKTWYIKNYMIFNSDRIGWTCDCKSFTFNVDDECKHILRVKEEFCIS